MDKLSHLGAMLQIAGRSFGQLLDAHAQEIGLTSVQMRTLHYLCKNESKQLHQRDIEQHFELSHPTVSGICARLEAKGFIVSEPCENDRRFRHIKPTEKALECTIKMRDFIIESEKKLVDGFSESEADEFIKYLQRVLNNLDFKPPCFFGEKKE